MKGEASQKTKRFIVEASEGEGGKKNFECSSGGSCHNLKRQDKESISRSSLSVMQQRANLMDRSLR